MNRQGTQYMLQGSFYIISITHACANHRAGCVVPYHAVLCYVMCHVVSFRGSLYQVLGYFELKSVVSNHVV